MGTEYDVRTVVSAMPRDVKDGFRYDAVPWQRFPHAYGPGEEIPALLEVLADDDAEAAARASSQLWNCVHHQGGGSETGALAVPFLLRIAASTRHPGLRADTLTLAAEIGHGQHLGDATRESLLHVAEDPLIIGAVDCPVDWTVQAARDAISADLHLPLPLLADPDPEVRSAAAFTLAVTTGETPQVTAALHDRRAAEDDPAVQVGLILAIAQLSREHHDEHGAGWARDLWSDPGRPQHIRIGAGIAWLCLVDDPAPDNLRAILTHPDTARLGDLFQQVPWVPTGRPDQRTAPLRPRHARAAHRMGPGAMDMSP